MGPDSKGSVTDFLLGSKITTDDDCSHEIRIKLPLGRKAMTNLDSVLKSRGITLLTKVHIVKAMVFPVVTCSCESWAINKAECQRIDAFETWCFTSESPLDIKKIKPVNLKGNQPWILIGRTNAEAEVPLFWSSDVNSWFIGKFPDVGKDWGQKEKRMSKDEMAGWHHQCTGHELGQISRDGEGQRGLVCCSPWGY